MQVICTDTNAMVEGWPVPPGAFELPVHGSLGVFTSGGVTTNLTVASGDTLMIWRTGACVVEGVEPWQMFLLGVWLVVSVFGVLAAARRMARFLSGGAVKEV